MTRQLQTVFLLILSMFVAVQAYGQSVKVETKAPAVVAADEMFRVEFTSSQRPENFRAPDFAGFNVLAGPSISESQSISIVQNNMTQTVQYTYTYVLKPTATGNFTIGQAVISIGGKEYSTRSTPIEVVAEGSPRPAGQGRQQGGAQQQAASAVAEDDIILRASVSRTSVFKGEPVRVTFKIYTRVPLGRSENEKFPSFNGFWSQELDTSNSKWQRESYNNKVYESRVLGEYLLYPLQSGALQIDPFQFTVTAHSINHRPSRSIFDDMMGGGPDILEEKKLIRSQPITITVNELPGGAPEGFEGAVGNFTMEADPPSGTINANSAVTYTVKISGTGNLSQIQAPKITMPSSFEQYNIKTTESINKGRSGVSGYRQFEYPFIARAEGEYSVEPVRFVYFNPEQSRYVTLTGGEVSLTVEPDTSGGASAAPGTVVTGLSKEEVMMLGQDIRYIQTGGARLHRNDKAFVLSLWYFVVLLAIVAAFFIITTLVKRRRKMMADIETFRGKRANKVALSRLRAAEQYMKADNKRRFHDEMLKALWGYMSDKLNIPVANLTKENVREELQKRGMKSEYISKYTDLISACEYAQYSPAEAEPMQEVYRQGVDAISKFESYIKK